MGYKLCFGRNTIIPHITNQSTLCVLLHIAIYHVIYHYNQLLQNDDCVQQLLNISIWRFWELFHIMYDGQCTTCAWVHSPPRTAFDVNNKQGHDDVIQWKNFPRYWPFVRVTCEFPTQRPVTRSFDVFVDLRKKLWGWWFEMPSPSLWRHCNGIARVESSPSGLNDFWAHVPCAASGRMRTASVNERIVIHNILTNLSTPCWQKQDWDHKIKTLPGTWFDGHSSIVLNSLLWQNWMFCPEV